MTVGLLFPALLATLFGVWFFAAAIVGRGSVLERLGASAFALFFAAVAVRDVRRWRDEMARIASEPRS